MYRGAQTVNWLVMALLFLIKWLLPAALTAGSLLMMVGEWNRGEPTYFWWSLGVLVGMSLSMYFAHWRPLVPPLIDLAFAVSWVLLLQQRGGLVSDLIIGAVLGLIHCGQLIWLWESFMRNDERYKLRT